MEGPVTHAGENPWIDLRPYAPDQCRPSTVRILGVSKREKKYV